MDLTKEQENFIKLLKIIVDIVPKHLRYLFIRKWNAKFPHQPWANDAASGQCLYDAMPLSVRRSRHILTWRHMIIYGNCELWTATALFFVFLYAGLKLIRISRPRYHRARPFSISENIDRLREIRNTFYGQVASMSIPDVDFVNVSTEIKEILKDMFGEFAADEVDQIVKSQIMTQVSYDLKNQLEIEEQVNYGFHKRKMTFGEKPVGMQFILLSVCFV